MRWATVCFLGLVGCGGSGGRVTLDASVPNQPPRVVQATPGLRTRFFTGPACRSQNPATFSVVVSEPEGDPLRSQWFIDETTGPFVTTPNFETGEPRTLAAPTAQAFWDTLVNLPSGTHVVTVWVTDADSLEVVDGAATALLDGGVGQVDSFTWVLDVAQCP